MLCVSVDVCISPSPPIVTRGPEQVTAWPTPLCCQRQYLPADKAGSGSGSRSESESETQEPKPSQAKPNRSSKTHNSQESATSQTPPSVVAEGNQRNQDKPTTISKRSPSSSPIAVVRRSLYMVCTCASPLTRSSRSSPFIGPFPRSKNHHRRETFAADTAQALPMSWPNGKERPGHQ